MNNQKEDIKKAAEVAQFRFGVIAPVVQDLYPELLTTKESPVLLSLCPMVLS